MELSINYNESENSMRKYYWVLCLLLIVAFVWPLSALAERVVVDNVPYIHQVKGMNGDDFNGHNACGPTSASMLVQFHNVRPIPTELYPVGHSREGELIDGWYVYNSYTGFSDKDGNSYDLHTAMDMDSGLNHLNSVYGAHGYIVDCFPDQDLGGGVLSNCSNATHDDDYWAADEGYLVSYLENHGLIVKKTISTDSEYFETIKQSIDAGLPLIAHSDIVGCGHYVIIKGYDTGTDNNQQNVVVNDPYGNARANWFGKDLGEDRTYPLSGNVPYTTTDEPPQTGTRSINIDRVYEVYPVGIHWHFNGWKGPNSYISSQAFIDCYNGGHCYDDKNGIIKGKDIFGIPWKNNNTENTPWFLGAWVHEWPNYEPPMTTNDTIYLQDFIRTDDNGVKHWFQLVFNRDKKVVFPVHGKILSYWHDNFGYMNFGEPNGLEFNAQDFSGKHIVVQEFVKTGQLNFIGYDTVLDNTREYSPNEIIADLPNVDVALIIDSSGSMSWNDPMNLREAAAKIFVHNADDDDQIAIIDFDSYTNVWWSLKTLTENRDDILAKIDLIDSSGGTNIGGGLQKGYDELNSSTKPFKKAAILLTDGVGSYNNQADDYADKNWPIYTIGLGSSVDTDLLQNIADTTGGMYFALSDPNQLQNVYFQIANTIKEGSKPILGIITLMFQGDIYNTTVTVDSYQEDVTFLITWPGSDVSTTLISPTGREITPTSNDPDVYHAKGLTYEIYKIDKPEPGEWSIVLYGVELDPEGENVSVNVSSTGPEEPLDTTPPIISVSNPIDGKMYFNQLPVACNFTIEDPESGVLEQSAMLNGVPISNDDELIFSQLGENTLTITATNNVNLSSEMTIKFTVCDFQWLPPIKYSKKSLVETENLVLKANRTYPIKFAVKDENGGFVVDQSVKVVVEGTTAMFLFGDTDVDVRINEFEDDGEPNYIVNIHTNFKKWDYNMTSGNEYFLNVYFDNILAGKTIIRVK